MINKKAERAKLFLPFDALKGLKEALREKEKIYAKKRTLSEEDASVLSNKIAQIKKYDMVKLIYYKEGEYLSLEGIVTKIDFEFKSLVIVKTKIEFKDLLDIEVIEDK